jgi:hypothetical protein
MCFKQLEEWPHFYLFLLKLNEMKQVMALSKKSLRVKSRSLLMYLIVIVSYLLLFIYFTDTVLCEGNETIYDLKTSLILETHKYRVHTINYELVIDTYNLMIGRPMHERNYDAELQFLSSSTRLTADIRETFSRINSLVTRIQIIEPAFQSPIQTVNYLRIIRS